MSSIPLAGVILCVIGLLTSVRPAMARVGPIAAAEVMDRATPKSFVQAAAAAYAEAIDEAGFDQHGNVTEAFRT